MAEVSAKERVFARVVDAVMRTAAEGAQVYRVHDHQRRFAVAVPSALLHGVYPEQYGIECLHLGSEYIVFDWEVLGTVMMAGASAFWQIYNASQDPEKPVAPDEPVPQDGEGPSLLLVPPSADRRLLIPGQ